MSSVTTTSLANTLPSLIPKLDASGVNRAIFLLCFQNAVEAKGYWGHFDDTDPCPVVPEPNPSPALPTAAATTSPTPNEAAAAAAAIQWNKDK